MICGPGERACGWTKLFRSTLSPMGKAHRKGTYLFGTKTLGSANSWDVAVSEVLAESRMTLTAELKCKRKCEINFGS